MPHYTLTHVGGLGDIVREEVAERVLGAQFLRGEYGRQHLAHDGDPAALFALRTVENIHATVLEIDDVSPRATWLQELEHLLAGVDLKPAVAVLARLKPLPASPTFRVTAERSGAHDFQSPEVAAAAGAGIVTGTGWRVDLKHFDIEVRVDVGDTQALIGLRLSEQALHKRSRVIHPRVTLNPTVAAAMVRLSLPQPGELVVDPMVGGGTLLTERYRHDPRVTLLGGDRFIEKVAMARGNFEALGVSARLAQWNAAWLPLADETVDKFLCNAPWGKLVASHKVNLRLYPWLLRHLRRCVRVGGRIVLLTSERALVKQFREAYPDMRLVYVQRLSLGGLEPSIHVLEKM